MEGHGDQRLTNTPKVDGEVLDFRSILELTERIELIEESRHRRRGIVMHECQAISWVHQNEKRSR